MKEKLAFVVLIIVCLGFFSFREVGNCNVKKCAGKCISDKVAASQTNGELSPFYNLLTI